MAKFIPNLNGHSFASPGEKDFFERLSRDSAAKDWVVLHSLEIAHHDTRVMGEIDYLVLIPGLGVLAIEIKAHEWINISNGKWFYGVRDKSGSTVSPFKQVKESTFSLKKYIDGRSPQLSSVVIHRLVIFTHLKFEQKSVEWHPSEFVDSPEFRSGEISTMLTRRLKKCKEYFYSKPTTRSLKSDSVLTSQQVNQLVDVLRPELDLAKSKIDYRTKIDAELLRFTKEQMKCLDFLEGNSQVVMNGGAGTGKTLLAVEAAIRAAREGKTVLLLCMNNLLAEHLQRSLESFPVDVSSLHSHFMSYGKLQPDGQDGFWTELLPEFVFDHLIDNSDLQGAYDVLVVDEAQDILWNDLWTSCLDLILHNGLKAGNWWMFGDFHGQSIYGERLSSSELKDKLEDFSGRYARGELKNNCRNLEAVSLLSLVMVGGKNPYQGYLRTREPFIEPKYYFYETMAEQVKIINGLVERLLKDGFKKRDIVILSGKSEATSCAKNQAFDFDIEPYRFDCENISHASVYRFKGLEAPIVILTDFEKIDGAKAMDIFLTGASRATETIFALFHNKVRTQFLANLQEQSNV